MEKTPQFLYLVLLLPLLFSLALAGEGIVRMLRKDLNGVVLLVFGIILLSVVMLGYLVLKLI